MGDFKSYSKKNQRRIDQNVQLINKTKRKLQKAEIGQQCECLHRMYNTTMLSPIPAKNGEEGKPKFRCRICQKVVSISKYSQEEIDNAFSIIDDLCDAVKLTSKDPESDATRMTIQYQKDSVRMHEMMNTLMGAINSQKKKNQNRDRNGGSTITFTWGE